mmetsp:Transcript_63629/g.152105  ORF Transcript_63629/g.152105 Transcript_63629/m.152105 type:complete len:361 (-) Transcript_63629:504-1586(-)
MQCVVRAASGSHSSFMCRCSNLVADLVRWHGLALPHFDWRSTASQLLHSAPCAGSGWLLQPGALMASRLQGSQDHLPLRGGVVRGHHLEPACDLSLHDGEMLLPLHALPLHHQPGNHPQATGGWQGHCGGGHRPLCVPHAHLLGLHVQDIVQPVATALPRHQSRCLPEDVLHPLAVLHFQLPGGRKPGTAGDSDRDVLARAHLLLHWHPRVSGDHVHSGLCSISRQAGELRSFFRYWHFVVLGSDDGLHHFLHADFCLRTGLRPRTDGGGPVFDGLDLLHPGLRHFRLRFAAPARGLRRYRPEHGVFVGHVAEDVPHLRLHAPQGRALGPGGGLHVCDPHLHFPAEPLDCPAEPSLPGSV